MRTLSLWLRVVAVVGLCGLLSAAASAQAPAWQTALALGTPRGSVSGIRATAVDASGNVYVVGTFRSTLSLGATTLNSAGSGDVFVAKWSPAGGFGWAQQVGGTGEEEATAVAVSGSSVYVAGRFGSSTLALGATTLANAGSVDGFVAKLVDGGSTSAWSWAQQLGRTGLDAAEALAVSGNSVYVAGDFNSPNIAFGATTLANAGGSAGRDDGFVAKLTDGGSSSAWTWAQQVGGTYSDGASALAVSGSNVYVLGGFNSSNLAVGATTLANAGFEDGFVAKLVDAGSTSAWTWVQQVGGTRFDYAFALAVSGSSVYVAGSFTSPNLAFGTTTLANTTAGRGDGYVAKLVDGGSTSAWAWAQQVGGTDSDAAYAVAVSGNSVYVTGRFASPNLAVGATTLANAGGDDGYVAKLVDGGSSSAWSWAQLIGGTGNEIPEALAVSGSSVYVAGDFNGPTLAFGSPNLTITAHNYTGFLAALGDPLLAVPAEASGAPTLAPNPASGLTTVRGAVPGGPLTVLDGCGRVVLRARVDADGAATLDVRGLAPGLYLVRGDGGVGRRLVVE